MKETFTYGSLRTLRVKLLEVTQLCVMFKNKIRQIDPKTSVLNKWNQLHEVPNVFVTDGAAMTSSACQNPSLTYMALTARAVDYAVKEMKKQNL